MGEHVRAGTLDMWVERQGTGLLRERLLDMTIVPPREEHPEFYRDVDAATDFAVQAKEGECAA